MGASSGMGQELAQLFLKEGWQIGIAARRIGILNQWRDKQLQLIDNGNDENSSRIITFAIDICHAEAPQQLLSLIDEMGGVDVYVHASGIGKQNPLLYQNIEMNTVRTNGLGFTQMIGTAFRYMAENGGGQIAVISSIAGTKGLSPAPSYSATKAFQNTYVQALEQLANSRKLNICFTDLRPGFVDTALLNGGAYPMLMDQHFVAKKMMRAINQQKHICVID